MICIKTILIYRHEVSWVCRSNSNSDELKVQNQYIY